MICTFVWLHWLDCHKLIDFLLRPSASQWLSSNEKTNFNFYGIDLWLGYLSWKSALGILRFHINNNCISTIFHKIYCHFRDNFAIFHMHRSMKRPLSFSKHAQNQGNGIYPTWNGTQAGFWPKEDVPEAAYPQILKMRSPKSNTQA